MKKSCFGVIVISLLIFVTNLGAGEKAAWTPDKDAAQTPAKLVTELYRAVTWAPGSAPDWEKVKTFFFIDEAVIVLRTSMQGMSVLSRQGFVDLFIADVKKYKLDEKGFNETLLSLQVTEFGNIAHALTVYEASIPGSQRKNKGVDSFQLMKKGERWWIVSVVNEVPFPGNPIPESFFNRGKQELEE